MVSKEDSLNRIHNKSEVCLEDLSNAFGATILDENFISWKYIDGKWIGKRAVTTNTNRACWIDEVNKFDTDKFKDSIKSYSCGEDADYSEIFYKDKFQ